MGVPGGGGAHHPILPARRDGMKRTPPGEAEQVQLDLPSAGPDPIPLDLAVRAVLGFARGRRPLWFRSPGEQAGRWVQLPAFGYDRFDRRPAAVGSPRDEDVLTAEMLHGRLDPAGWGNVRHALDDTARHATAAVDRAAGRPFWELPDDEVSVLGEPGTVGACLREIWNRGTRAGHPEFVSAALHHRRPALIPHIDRTTRLQFLPHLVEGDSGIEAVIHRELRANAEAFAALESTLAALLVQDGDVRLTRLRLHDVLVWLSGSLRLTHALELGGATPEWQQFGAGELIRRS